MLSIDEIKRIGIIKELNKRIQDNTNRIENYIQNQTEWKPIPSALRGIIHQIREQVEAMEEATWMKGA
jgi:hypothetical protein